MKPEKCPTCQSPAPHLHPAMQYEGEVELCRDRWHKPSIAAINAANAKRRAALESGERQQ